MSEAPEVPPETETVDAEAAAPAVEEAAETSDPSEAATEPPASAHGTPLGGESEPEIPSGDSAPEVEPTDAIPEAAPVEAEAAEPAPADDSGIPDAAPPDPEAEPAEPSGPEAAPAEPVGAPAETEAEAEAAGAEATGTEPAPVESEAEAPCESATEASTTGEAGGAPAVGALPPTAEASTVAIDDNSPVGAFQAVLEAPVAEDPEHAAAHATAHEPAAVEEAPGAEESGAMAGSAKEEASSTASSAERPRPGTVESLGHMQLQPRAPSKIKTHEPWLKGTFKTPNGRIITGDELSASVDRMYNAFASKLYAPTGTVKGTTNAMAPKTLSSSEIDDVITRLYQTKSISEGDEGKLERVQLKFDKSGKEKWEPIKSVSNDDQKEYLCSLYTRCIESKKKTQDDLAAKYLQPLVKAPVKK